MLLEKNHISGLQGIYMNVPSHNQKTKLYDSLELHRPDV